MSAPEALDVITPRTAEDLAAVRRLAWQYRAFLLGLGPVDAEIVRTFYPRETYARLLEAIEVDHAPPNGAMRLALVDGEPVGTGMVRTLAPGDAEIKRVYVCDRARGMGAGRAIMEALIGDCRAMGFSRILLDTGRPLEAAQALCLRLGFRRRGPYQPVPEIARDRIMFFEKPL